MGTDPITTRIVDLFKPGIGPSSSHTMGPMRAALDFLTRAGPGSSSERLRIHLRGSLGATGKGHATDRAILAGLCGLHPAEASAERIETAVQSGRAGAPRQFDPSTDLHWDPFATGLPHPNTLDFEISDASGHIVCSERYLSIGGGFIDRVGADGRRLPLDRPDAASAHAPRYPLRSAVDVIRICKREELRWSDIARANERALGNLDDRALDGILRARWARMRDCIARGISASPGELPGGLHVHRRAPAAFRAASRPDAVALPMRDPVALRAHAYALAVNEENACGGSVVTAPTNGAAGVIPATFAALQDEGRVDEDAIVRGLLAAGLIGALIKEAASLSGAEMGCQGEVGSACAMAAGGVVEMMGGTVDQVEMAAEIGIEHHLGMTCDPVAGLVQIPCIERNIMGAVKALHAATLALGSTGKHRISLDESIAAMRQIGLDLNAKYKETAQGGLAVVRSAPHHVEC